MTIIAVSAGEMAADSWAFASYVGYPKADGYSKIIRTPNGLFGSAGSGPQLFAVREWIRNGMDLAEKPDFADSDDDRVSILWLKNDGTLWHFTTKAWLPYPVSIPYSIGQEHACHMAEGAILAGKTAGEALELIVPRCTHTGGPIQVERLNQVCEPGEIIEVDGEALRYGRIVAIRR